MNNRFNKAKKYRFYFIKMLDYYKQKKEKISPCLQRLKDVDKMLVSNLFTKTIGEIVYKEKPYFVLKEWCLEVEI